MKKNLLYLNKFSILPTLFLLFFISNIIAQPVSWDAKGIGGGGALFSPSISPHNNNEVFVACDMTEVFHTTNAGVNWTTIPFQQLTSVVSSKIQYTSDANILFALNSDFFSETNFPVKSIDGGTTWNELASDPTGGGAYYLFADDANTNRVIVSDYSHIYFSDDGGASFDLIYTNGGSGAAHIGGVFWDGTNIYIGAAKHLIVSTDNGATFTSSTLTGISASRGIMSFAGAKSGGTTRFFVTVFNLADIYPGVTGADFSLYKSIYKMDYTVGATWTAAVTGISGSNKPFFISMSKNNIDVAYCSGGNTSTSYPIVFKTINGGASWSAVLKTSNNENIYTGYQGDGGDEGWYYDEFAEGFSVASNNNNVAVITGLGYPHITTDGGSTWKQMYVNPADENPINTLITKGKNYAGAGLENTSCWSICWSDANNLFAGFSDITGMQSSNAGNKWNKSLNGLTENSVYKVIKENSTGKIYAATSSVHDMYQSTYLQDSKIDGGTGAIKYSTDNGINWSMLHDFTDPVVWITLDPNTSNKMYACVVNSSAGGIYVSTNINLGSSSTWSKLSNPPRTQGHPYNLHVLNDGTLIAAYSGRRDAAGTFLNSSGVFKSTDGGTSWTDVSDTGMYYWTKDLIIDPFDVLQNTFYVCVFSGWGGPPNGLGGIYKTTNRGTSWAKINESDRVESCTINPNNSNEMYFSTEAEGLWKTTNLIAATPTFSQVTNYPFMHPVRIFFNPFNTNEIWITSFGNGMKMGLNSNCAIPDNLIASGITSTSATVTWDAIAGATLYKVTNKVVGGATYNYTVLTNSITLTTLTPGTTNKVSVKAKCGTTFSGSSVKITIITPLKLGNTFSDLIIYPNPADDLIQIKSDDNAIGNIELLNLQGEKMKVQKTITSGQITLHTHNLPDGMYILILEGETILKEKIIIQH
ncbi:MAG: T9SS type A sorting domain-containing protein [Fimbriimonadaceae bacterium]|nr:T9SS type A sorting domain-containing protein [Chitinophagales bacterium]